MAEGTTYWWNDTAIEYTCDGRSPSDKQWKELELVSAGTRMKSASAPYCNATATYRGGSFVSINGAIDKNGSTWGCSVDGERWTWYSQEGNGESWKGIVLCAWDDMNSKDDIQTWLASDPSGKTAVAVGSWIGLPSDKTEEGKTSAFSFYPTISQPIPVDLDATSTSSSSISPATTASLSASSASSSPVTDSAASRPTSTGSNPTSSTSSSKDNSVAFYGIIGAATVVIVGGIITAILCLKQKGENRQSRTDSEDDSLLSSDEERHRPKRSKGRRSTVADDYRD